MAIKRINPSRNAWDNTNRQSYGYVIRVPKLPDAHKLIVDFTVFNEEDNCFYKCVEINANGQHYYTWTAVTFGSSRAYLIPIGKLTATNITEVTEKTDVGSLPKTLNEFAFGMRRYHGKTHYPIGYQLATGVYGSGDYYKWEWNDTVDSIEMVTRKRYTGELKKIEPHPTGPITEEVYTLTLPTTVSGEPKWDDITMRDMAAKINEFAERFNAHDAGIPLASESDSLERMCEITNLMIEEVNPFCIPWQLLLNRQNFLELEVGQAELQTTGITPEIQMASTNLAKWATASWECFYIKTSDTEYVTGKDYYIREPAPTTTPKLPWDYVYTKIENPTPETPILVTAYELYKVPPTLLYGTVCQAIDAALSVIKYQDIITGRWGDLKDFTTGSTLVDWLNALKAQVDSYTETLIEHRMSLKQIHDSIGDVGFVRPNYANFKDIGATSDPWKGYWYWDETKSLFIRCDTVAPCDPGTSISAWETANNKIVYCFQDTDIARVLINKNAADIIVNKQLVDNVLGTQLFRIYVETLDPTGTEGSKYYYYSSTETTVDHPFIEFTLGAGETLDEWRETMDSPIFIPCTRDEYIVNNEKVATETKYYYYDSGSSTYMELTVTVGDDLDQYRTTAHPILYSKKQTAAVQIRVNNEEIGRLRYDLRKVEKGISEKIEEAIKRTKRLKQLTGVNGDDDVLEEWVVDGYVELTKAGDFRDLRKYYVHKPGSSDPNEMVELISGTKAEYDLGYKFILTQDEIFKSQDPTDPAHVDYYTRTGSTIATYVYTKATVTAGEAVAPNTYFVKLDVDYVLPYYTLTEDLYFQAGKDYYTVNEDGKYIKTAVTPGEEVEANTYYEFINPTIRPAGGVYIRKARIEHEGYEENETHRGLIDRNTRDIEDDRQANGAFQKWTKQQIQAIEDYIFSLLMSTVDVITQERSTLSLLHDTAGKFITFHNSLERIKNIQTVKPADGTYDSGYDYYTKGDKKKYSDYQVFEPITGITWDAISSGVFEEGITYYVKCSDTKGVRYVVYDTSDKIGEAITSTYYVIHDSSTVIKTIKRWVGTGFFLTKDPLFVATKTYYTRTGGGTTSDPYVYMEYTDTTGGVVPANTYYEYHDWYLMESGVDYEIGLEVTENVYTKDLVIATTENYTINEIRLAVNRAINYHIDSGELPLYTELPDTEIILESMTYYRYVDGEWEEIIPEVDDPTMIGQRIKDYDPLNKWYIKTGSPVPDGTGLAKYTETPIRMLLNELIKLHRKGQKQNNPIELAAKMITGLSNFPNSSTYATLPAIFT